MPLVLVLVAGKTDAKIILFSLQWVLVEFISWLEQNCQSNAQSSASLPQHTNDFVGEKKKYTQARSPTLGPDSGADISDALVSFRVIRCVPRMTTLPPMKVGSSHPETKQWPRRGVTSAPPRLVEDTRRMKPSDPTEEQFTESLLCVQTSIHSSFPISLSRKLAPSDFLISISL